MIKYIEILNRQIKIYDTKFCEKINLTLEKYLNMLLLDDLTTFKGRIDSIKNKYNYYKLTPIYITNNLCLIPITNRKKLDNIYINIYSISFITKDKEIYFIDNTKLIVNVKKHLLEKYISRAKLIQK